MVNMNQGNLYFNLNDQAYKNYKHTLVNSTERHDIKVGAENDKNGQPEALIFQVGKAGTLSDCDEFKKSDTPSAFLKADYKSTEPKNIGFLVRKLIGRFDYAVRNGENQTYFKPDGVFLNKISEDEFHALHYVS